MQRAALIGSWNPEEDGILCTQSRPPNLLPSSQAYDGNADAKRRSGSVNHPGPPRARVYHDDSAIRQSVEPEGATGLPQGHGEGCRENQ